MASSRRLPTSYNTSTYGNSTRDYTSLATWEAATDNDLVTATAGEVLECYDDATSFDDRVDINGATTSSSYFRVIKPAAGQGHDGTPNNGVMFQINSGTIDPIIDLLEDYTGAYDLILEDTGTRDWQFVVGGTGSQYKIVGCIVSGPSGSGSRAIATSGLNAIIANCIAYNSVRGFDSHSDPQYFYNCTAVNCTTGFVFGNNSIAKNCAAVNCTTDFSGTWTKTTCYEGDATSFEDQANDDYHLASDDTTCIDQGTDLSSDSDYAFDDDIDQETRESGSWDIGFDEYVAAITITDTGSGNDAVGQINASISVADAGAGAETIKSGVYVSKTVQDIGAGVDAVQSLSVSLTVQDPGVGADAISSILASLSVQDTGAGAESVTPGQFRTVQDAGSGAENIIARRFVTVQDTGAGQDTVSIPSVSLTVQDTGAGADVANGVITFSPSYLVEVTPRAETTTAIGWEDTDAISVQHRAIDLTLKSLDTAWLCNLGAYYWSTQDIMVNGQVYSAKIDPASLSDITISKAYNGAERIHVLEDITFEIPDSAGAYTSSNFLDLDVDVYAYVDDGTNAGAIRKFLYVVIGAKKIYDILYLTLRDRFVHDELEALYPTSARVQDIWASDGDSQLGYCMPIPFGTAFIPMPSIYITNARWYLLGETDGTYTITKVQSPQSWPKSVWNSAGYSFFQATEDTYRVFWALIADGNNGLFPEGSQFLPISVEYTRSDTSTITNPANIIADLIFAGSGITIDPAFYSNDTTFEGAFTHQRPRYEWASEILKASNAVMVIGENGHRQIKNLVPTAYGQLTTANIISDSFDFDPIVSDENYDGGYIQFPKAGDPQHVLYKYRVGLGNSASGNPSSDTLNLQFIDDSQEAQKFGVLYFERLVGKSADVQAGAWLDMMRLNPDAVLGISGSLYDSAVAADMVVDSVSISADMTVSIKGEQFDHSLSIFDDLTPSALSIAVDDSTGTWTPIIVGPDGTDSLGNRQNALTKHLQITSGGTIKVGTDPVTGGGLLIDEIHIAGYSSLGTKLQELVYAGTNEGDAYFGDYDSGNAGVKYDHSAAALSIRGSILIQNPTTVRTDINVADGADATSEHAGNLIDNPGFEAGDIGWDKQTGWAITTGNAFLGSYAAEHTGTAGSAGMTNIKFATSVGERFLVSAQIKADSGADGNWWIQIRAYQADGTFISRHGPADASMPGTSWTQVKEIATMPAGAAYGIIQVSRANSTTGTFYVDNVMCVPDTTETSINGGLISTGYIQSNNYDATNGMKIDFNNAKITVNEAGGLTINAADGIKLAPGADLYLEAESGNQGTIYFLTAAGDYVELAANYDNGILFLSPVTPDTSGLWIGYDSAGTFDRRFDRIVTSSHSLSLYAGDRSGSPGEIRIDNFHEEVYAGVDHNTAVFVNPSNVDIMDFGYPEGGSAYLKVRNTIYPYNGIAFGGPGNDVLDDYEADVYTVTCSPATSGSVTLDSTRDLLSYIKTGDSVRIRGQIDVASVSSPSGYLNFSLPFTAAAGSEGETWGSGVVVISNVNLDTNYTYMAAYVAKGSSSFRLYECGDNVARKPYGSDSENFTGNETLVVNFEYKAA